MSDLQRSIDRARSCRFAAVCGAVIDMFLIAVSFARHPESALVPAVALVALLALVVMQTRLIGYQRRRQELTHRAEQLELAAEAGREHPEWKPAIAGEWQRLKTGTGTIADFEAGMARLTATLGSCAHPAAEPVDLLLTGERVAWVCPDCSADLPAGWSPATGNRAATLTGAGSISAASLSGAGNLPAEVAATGCECGDSDVTEVRVPDSAAPVARYCRTCLQLTYPPAEVRADELRAAFRDFKAAIEAERRAPEHFAALARVGREFCLSYCPICADRLDARMRSTILAPKPDLGDVRGDLKRDMRDLSDLDGIRTLRQPSVTSNLVPAGACDFHLDSAGREWCRDADDLCWIKPTPDGLWHRMNKPEGNDGDE